jgi:deazaflavin-dependent oxidoreductase (nitroreductase family)
MKHLVNPVVKAILRSPVHRIMSSRLALITLTGRRSGRRYTLPVGYQRTDNSVTINVGTAERKQWWRNLRTGARVRLRLRGVDYDGWAQAAEGDSSGIVATVALGHNGLQDALPVEPNS